jgi:hypothetical protein
VRRKKLLALRHLLLRVVIFVTLIKKPNTGAREIAQKQKSKKEKELAGKVQSAVQRQLLMRMAVQWVGNA